MMPVNHQVGLSSRDRRAAIERRRRKISAIHQLNGYGDDENINLRLNKNESVGVWDGQTFYDELDGTNRPDRDLTIADSVSLRICPGTTNLARRR